MIDLDLSNQLLRLLQEAKNCASLADGQLDGDDTKKLAFVRYQAGRSGTLMVARLEGLIVGLAAAQALRT